MPLFTELVAPLDARKLTVGSPVFATVMADWSDPACHLKNGSTIGGHVVEVKQDSKQDKGSSFTIDFDHADCSGQNVPIHFLLLALATAPPVTEGRSFLDSSDSFGVLNASPLSNNSHSVVGNVVPSSASPLQAMASSKMNFDLRSDAMERDKPTNNAPSVIEPGKVLGLSKAIKLTVASGQQANSILSSASGNLRLEQSTRLMLSVKHDPHSTPGPTLEAAVSASPALGAAPAPLALPTVTPATPPPPRVPEINETSLCTDSCSLVPDEEAVTPSHATAMLSTRALGFISHDSQISPSFGFESALFYLDAKNILFTYDPHRLRQRIPSGYSSDSVRTVRAVLLDSSRLTVKRMMDWKIEGDGEYIWRVGTDKILLHLGHTLRLLSPDLSVLSELQLPGKLAFVSVSPSGDRIAVGMLNERHTRAMHDELLTSLNTEPEEDVEIQLFDQKFTPLLHSRQTTHSAVPVLSDTGEVRVYAQLNKKDYWIIREQRWDLSQHDIAIFPSTCKPTLTTPQSGMLFLVGCKTNFENWYRVLRMDGHLLLSGRGAALHNEECFSNDKDSFAIRVIRSQSGIAAGTNYEKKDLTGQEVSIYRSSDGKRLFSVVDSGVSFARQAFTISPTGDQLAVLSNTQISLYPVTNAKP